jgi:hypothetical protein
MHLRHTLIPVALAIGLLSVRTHAQQSPPARSSSSKSAKPEQHIKREPAGELAEKVYRNATYGFAYKIPYGWVERTREMQPDDTDAAKGDTAKGEPAKGKVLLAVFERPPEAPGETVNSAVVIAEEPASSYPGLKTAADYSGPVTELATSKGFQAAGDPEAVTLDGKALVRCDFVREAKLAMHQSTLILLQKGSLVSFTFIGGSAEEVEDLMNELSFGGTPKGPAKK